MYYFSWLEEVLIIINCYNVSIKSKGSKVRNGILVYFLKPQIFPTCVWSKSTKWSSYFRFMPLHFVKIIEEKRFLAEKLENMDMNEFKLAFKGYKLFRENATAHCMIAFTNRQLESIFINLNFELQSHCFNKDSIRLYIWLSIIGL